MADRFKYDNVRQKIIDSLKMDLMGPKEENEILDEEIDLINEFSSDDTLLIETTKRKSQYKELKNFENIIVETPNKGGEYLRNNLDNVLEKIGFSKEQDEIIGIYEKLAIYKIKKSSQEEDKLLIQAINSVDDIDESIAYLLPVMIF